MYFPWGCLNHNAFSGEGGYYGFAESREHVLLQPNTQRRVVLNCSEINKQPILLVEPKNRIGLICIAQDAAD